MLVHHFLENSAARLPQKVALITGEQRLTYQHIDHLSDKLAASLTDMGVCRQNRVAIFLENSAESVISLFGALKAGAIFILLNSGMKAKKLNYILKDSGTGVLITHKNKFRIVKEAIRDASDLRDIIWVEKFSAAASLKQNATNHSWDNIFSLPQASGLKPQASVFDSDLAAIIYTSGSSGEPKGVISSHSNMVFAAQCVTSYLENVEDDIILNTLPLSFSYGLYQILMAFLFGGTVVLEKSFAYPYKIIERLIKERVTGFPVVPTMLAIMLQMGGLSKLDFSFLRYISSAAAALPVAHIRKFQEFFPHIKLYSMYGLTECTRVCYLPPEYLDQKPDSVGTPMSGVEVLIVNDKGEELESGKTGELVVRGPNVMQGYWIAPEETARTFWPGRSSHERLLYTGDLFRKDEDGFLYFVARKDDLIKVKGERVSPKEVENVLCELVGVVEAAAIGIPDEISGQAIKVFVVAKTGARVTTQQIIRYCQQNMESFMVPKEVEIRKSLPKSSSGKIDKKKLKLLN